MDFSDAWAEMFERWRVMAEEYDRKADENRRQLEELIESGKPFRIVVDIQ